jgi:nucleotide-binding universal stress UspA family protein
MSRVGADVIGLPRVDPSSVSRARSILVAHDGSEAGRRALDAAADLMGYGSTLAVVSAGTSLSSDPLADASHYLSSRHVFARYIDGDGHPAETILEVAAELGADVIVVAALSDSLESVARRAPCDVLVVR